MKKLIAFLLFLITLSPAICQQTMPVFSDTGAFSTTDNFIGLKIGLADYNIITLNQDLRFSYTSQNNGFVMSHDMNVKGINNIPHLSLGVDETAGHLLINFLDASIGYNQHTWNWTAGLGAGYALSLNKKNTLMLRMYANLFYENITYGLGSYSDSTLQGFLVNQVNIGTYVKNIKYVNNALCVSPGLELLYRRNKLSFFLGAAYNYTLIYKEKLDFYRTHIPLNNGLYNSSGSPITQGAMKPGNYIIQLGIVKEFGL
jgi:hypothetical protein